jgi:hypothetical protein
MDIPMGSFETRDKAFDIFEVVIQLVLYKL